MKTFHHIIAAIDFTPYCRAALREAARRASLDHAQITAVHVMDEALVQALKKAQSTDEATVRREWQAKLTTFVEESDVGAGIVRTEVRVGHPFLGLLEACATHSADLMVMGAKGSKDEPGRIGAIAAKCVRRAPVDVLIVRKSAQGPFKHVVACVDFSENAAKAVQVALHVAEQDKAGVDCLYVYQSAMAMALDYGGFAAPLPPMESEDEAVKAWKLELDGFIAPLTRKAESVPVKPVMVESLNIREAILDHVKAAHADLVVLGTRGKSGLRELLIGTTAEKIVQHATCSILAVKPDELGPADD